MKTIQRYLKMMLVLVAMLMGIQAMAQDVKEAYAVYEQENYTLVFYYDSDRWYYRDKEHLQTFDLNEGEEKPAWYDLNIVRMLFYSDFAGARPTSTSYWINPRVAEIMGTEFLNTSEVTTMYHMFFNNVALRGDALDLSHFDTRKVTNMAGMFYGCTELTSIDVSKFNTSNVVSMQEMFGNCSSLKQLDLRNFDTSKVTSMVNMFAGCTALESIDMSKFNTSSLENMDGMFNGCRSLTSLDLSSFDTQNVTNMDHLFFNCNSLETIYAGNKWDTSNVNQAFSRDLFSGCSSLVGGKGTAHEWYYDDQIGFARIDGGKEAPGYFTAAPQTSISTSINGLKDSVKGQREGWYTINGQKIAGNPTKKGVYIHNGKTVVR